MRTEVIALFLFSNLSLHAKPPAEKMLLVRIDEIGLVTVGRDTVDVDHLSRYIQERLFKSYMGTGQMYNKIRLEKWSNEISDVVVDVIIREIKSGQSKALSELSVHKYRKRFEDLDPRKQDKMQKQFPVLFQEISIQRV